jgi:hypothetical protein
MYYVMPFEPVLFALYHSQVMPLSAGLKPEPGSSRLSVMSLPSTLTRTTSRTYFARYSNQTVLCLLGSKLEHLFHDQVDDRMLERESARGEKQVPERKIRAFKKLYLNPGIFG